MATRSSFSKLSQVYRSYATEASRAIVRQKIKAKQELFQEDNGIGVHLKGGHMDKIIVSFTTLLCVLGVTDGLYTAFKMVFKNK